MFNELSTTSGDKFIEIIKLNITNIRITKKAKTCNYNGRLFRMETFKFKLTNY